MTLSKALCFIELPSLPGALQGINMEDFIGNTFVAFLDISGFKKLMKGGKAWDALDKLYSNGFKAIRDQDSSDFRVEGIFISDCGILFVRNNSSAAAESNEERLSKSLNALLSVIKEINIKMIKKEFMLTTSIAYGGFKYQDRIEIPEVRKAPICGNAYLDAFLDTETSGTRIRPGECRILKNTIVPTIHQLNHLCVDTGPYLYYYWMCHKDHQRIKDFRETYNSLYNGKYENISSRYINICKLMRNQALDSQMIEDSEQPLDSGTAISHNP
jgi:hypothetical protein